MGTANLYKKRKDAARARAIEWQLSASDRVQSWYEYAQDTARLERLGRRYGLLREFRENGII